VLGRVSYWRVEFLLFGVEFLSWAVIFVGSSWLFWGAFHWAVPTAITGTPLSPILLWIVPLTTNISDLAIISARFLINEIAHQGHITGVWLRLLASSHGSFGSTILLCILNDLTCSSWFPLVRDDLTRWFLRFHHIMILRYNIIRSNCNFLVRFCNFGSYKFFFIDFF
jgi:hypothetical protein